jgi:hypothetical protein
MARCGSNLNGDLCRLILAIFYKRLFNSYEDDINPVILGSPNVRCKQS